MPMQPLVLDAVVLEGLLPAQTPHPPMDPPYQPLSSLVDLQPPPDPLTPLP
jgi:hypothetical protein